MASSLGPSKLLVFGPSGVHASTKFTAEGLLQNPFSDSFSEVFSEVRAAFRLVPSCLHDGKDSPLHKRGGKEH